MSKCKCVCSYSYVFAMPMHMRRRRFFIDVDSYFNLPLLFFALDIIGKEESLVSRPNS